MLTTAFILGLAGSLHCVGMCSPLAFAVTGMKTAAIVNRLVYNTGRIFVYGLLGMLVSTIGVALPLEKFQTSLSFAMGILFIFIGILGTTWIKIPYSKNPLYGFTNFLKAKFNWLIQKRSALSIFFMGSLNGMLPCGLTLIALTSCLILPTAWGGFYFMLMFGLGTLPMMLGFNTFLQWLIKAAGIRVGRIRAVMLILAGSLLLGRIYLEHTNHEIVSSQAVTEVICE
jgi:uncharacterized protein